MPNIGLQNMSILRQGSWFTFLVRVPNNITTVPSDGFQYLKVNNWVIPFFLWRYSPNRALDFPHLGFLDYRHTHTHTHTHTVGLLWMGDQPVQEANTHTTHSKHKRETSMPLAEFETAIPVMKRLQTCRNRLCNTVVISSHILHDLAIITNQHTRSTEQSPSWEANSSSASQEIPRILWIRYVHYLLHKILPFARVQSHINSIHALLIFFKIHSNIILTSMPRSSKWSRSVTFPYYHTSPPHL